ncbi:hypothetical protein AB0A69_33495 [Streptomyces sp. NPDC045431]|uniref:hypothetical protein n=1 Tax=Streptomyces sp. NPDC045431 TaxID=3155613 RepID=UPI003406C787
MGAQQRQDQAVDVVEQVDKFITGDGVNDDQVGQVRLQAVRGRISQELVAWLRD